jgi:hypothetical protein
VQGCPWIEGDGQRRRGRRKRTRPAATISSSPTSARTKPTWALAAIPRDAQPSTYEAASARIRDLFASVAVPETVVRELREARRVLGDAATTTAAGVATDPLMIAAADPTAFLDEDDLARLPAPAQG